MDDIIIRRFQDSTTVWVSERYLCGSLGNNIAEYLRRRGRLIYRLSISPCLQDKDILPDTGKSWRYAKMNGQFYYDYDRIPDRKNTRFRSRLGEKETLLQTVEAIAEQSSARSRRELEKEIDRYVTERVDNRDIRFYTFYEVGGVCKFNRDKARDLAEALAWLRVIKGITENKSYADFGVKTQADFFELCASVLHRKNLTSFTITTGASLRKKLFYFPADPAEQYRYLISSRLGNDNARKIGKYKLVDTETGEIKRFDIHEALILKLWMNFGGSNKETKIALWEKYEKDIAYLGETSLSYSTFCHYTNMYDTRLKTYAERHGWTAFSNTFLTYIPSAELRYGNSLWCADGSGTLAYSYMDRSGTLRSMRLYVMLVSDVATGKIVGWCPAAKGQHNETPEMVRQAMIMALGDGRRREVMEFVSDNHGAFTGAETVELLTNVCRKVRTIEPHNSQANYAETQFRLFKKTLRTEFNWLGSSWAATDIDNTANEDYLSKEKFPSYEEVLLQVGQKIEDWNNRMTRAGQSRSELYAESIHPDAVEIDERIWRKVAGNRTKQEITRQRGNLVIEKAGKKYMFEIPMVESVSETIKSYLSYAATVDAMMYWDEEGCDLYTLDDRYMFSCYAARKASKSHAELSDESIEAQGHHEARKARMLRAVEQFNSEAAEVADWLEGETEPERYGIAQAGEKHAKEATNGAIEAAYEERSTKKSVVKTVFKERLKAEKTAKKEAEKEYEKYAKSVIDIDKFRYL